MLKRLPEDVWELVEAVRNGSGFLLIAECDDEDISVYAEADHTEPQAYISVEEAGEIVFFTTVSNCEECTDAVAEIYDTLFPQDDSDDENSEDPELTAFEENEDEIAFREQELKDAAEDFIAVVARGAFKTGDIDPEVMAGCLVDAVAKSMYRKGYDIYRPMFLMDEETKEIEYCEFPYSQLS